MVSAIVNRINTATALDKESVQALSLKLFLAIQEKNETEIRRLISAGADLAYVHNGKTPIECAAASSWTHGCIEVIASCKKVDANDSYGYGKAFNAILSNKNYWDSKIICALLRAGARPDLKLHTLHSLLFKAIENKDVELIKTLIECGVNLSQIYADGNTPIMLAGSKNLWQCVEAIATNKNTDANDSYEYRCALLYAVYNKKYETVKTLLQKGSKTNSHYKNTGNSPLHIAIYNNDIAMIRLLLEHKADLSVENLNKQTPMQYAVSLGKWDCVEAIANAANTDGKDTYKYNDALLAAVKIARTGTVTILLDANTPATGKVNGKSLIHIAIDSQNKNIIPQLIKNGVNLADVNANMETAMDYALSIGAWDYVTAIATNKDVDDADSYRYGKALVAAVKNNKSDVVLALLKAGVLKLKTPEVDQILFTAMEYASHELILKLIEFGANMAAQNYNHKTPIQQAASELRWDLVTKIANAKNTDATDSYRYGAALVRAAENNKYDVVSAILGAGPVHTNWHITGNKNTSLHHAVMVNNVEMIKLLLKHNCDLSVENDDHETPIVMAANQSKWRCVSEIVNNQNTNEKDTYQYGKAAMILMSAGAHRDDIKKLIDAGVCKKAENAANLFVEAAKLGKLEIAEDILNAGADINSKNSLGNVTALHAAVISNKINALRFLLEKGANQSVIANHQTPLELAIIMERWDCAQLLLEFDHTNGNDKQLIADLHYEQALVSAIRKGNYVIVKLLLEHHAPFDKIDSEHGNIALYWAVNNNERNPEIVSLLLEHGADSSIRNKDGKTILEVAKDLGHWECLKRLKLYQGHIHPGKSAVQYRAEADALYQEMSGYSVTPDAMPEKIVRLSEYSRAILECDLAALIKRRDELAKQKTETLPQLLDVSDSVSDSVKLNTTIDAIQSLLTHPHNTPPSYTARNEDRDEAKDIADFLLRKGAMDGYIKNIKRYLISLENQIENTHWLKYRPVFKDFVRGTPKQILAMKAQLKKLKNLNTRDEVFEIYAAVRKILLGVKKNDKRHDTTMSFYREQLQKVNAIRFIEEAKEGAELAVTPFTKEIMAATVSIAEKMPAGYVPMYPTVDSIKGTINYNDIPLHLPVTTAYPVLEKAPASVQEITLKTVTQENLVAIPATDLIDFTTVSEPAIATPPEQATVAEDKEIVLPDVPVKPIVRQASKSDLYKQPVEKETEKEKVHAAPRKQLVAG